MRSEQYTECGQVLKREGELGKHLGTGERYPFQKKRSL
jgi:hypothetical protein